MTRESRLRYVIVMTSNAEVTVTGTYFDPERARKDAEYLHEMTGFLVSVEPLMTATHARTVAKTYNRLAKSLIGAR